MNEQKPLESPYPRNSRRRLGGEKSGFVIVLVDTKRVDETPRRAKSVSESAKSDARFKDLN